jgi:hypothetical protein
MLQVVKAEQTSSSSQNVLNFRLCHFCSVEIFFEDCVFRDSIAYRLRAGQQRNRVLFFGMQRGVFIFSTMSSQALGRIDSSVQSV